MALGSVSGTGPISFDPSKNYNEFSTFGFFSGAITGLGTSYAVSLGPSILDFGLNHSEIVIINTGSTYLAFQWKEFAGQAVDNGVVPPGQTIILRNALKSGMKVRCADSAGTASCLVWAV
jgi:hypothetical protein